MKNKLSVILILAFSMAILFACDTFFTGPQSSDPEIDLRGLQLFAIPFPDANDPASVQLLEAMQPKYIMNYSTLAPEENEKAYKYDRFELLFPPEVTQLAGDATRRVTVRYFNNGSIINSSGTSIDDKQIIRTVNYLIPDHDIAQQMLLRQTRIFEMDSSIGLLVDDSTLEGNRDEYIIILASEDRPGCEVVDTGLEECYYIDGFINPIYCIPILQLVCKKIHVEEYGGGDGGNPGSGDGGDGDGDGDGGDTTPPDNEDDDDDPCQAGDGTGEDPDSGNPGDGSLPGGGTGDHDGGGIMNMPECDECTMPNPPTHCYDDEEEPEPCDTGNAVVDSLGGQGVFQNLWEMSNPNSEMENRLEQGGWIIETSQGVQFEPFFEEWVYSPCGIDPPSNFFVPNNAIGMIHTHPFYPGEDTTPVCGPEGEEEYEQGFSGPDFWFKMTIIQATNNFSFTSYLIDGAGITTMGILGLSSEQKYQPCGYNP